jgi:hypothetical protein
LWFGFRFGGAVKDAIQGNRFDRYSLLHQAEFPAHEALHNLGIQQPLCFMAGAVRLPDRDEVTKLGWEGESKCEGIDTLVDFKVWVAKANTVDPGMYVFRSPVDPHTRIALQEFARTMDLVLELLERTADVLAAAWDMRSEGTGRGSGRYSGGFERTVQ